MYPRCRWTFAAGRHAANPGISEIAHGALWSTANKFLSRIEFLEALHSYTIGPPQSQRIHNYAASFNWRHVTLTLT